MGKFLQLLTSFVGGFVIAFAKGWLLTLVMLASVSATAIAGGIMAIMMLKMAARRQNASAKAGVVVEQTISSIRTVCNQLVSTPLVYSFQIMTII